MAEKTNNKIKLGLIQRSTDKDDNAAKKQTILYLDNESRLNNLLVYGSKSSGKSQFALPLFFKQDLDNKNAGITVVVNKKDMAYTLYAMAKEARRKVTLLKPSANFNVYNDLISRDRWNYNATNAIINYKKAIRDKEIVIIDMEQVAYRQNAIRATAILLLQLQTDMTLSELTLNRQHFVYIDDAQYYLPFIETLLVNGNSYNVSTTLFMQSRGQFKVYNEDYSQLIENNVKNHILMNNLTFEDTLYWAERLYTDEDRSKRLNFNDVARRLLNRKYGVFAYEVLNEGNERSTGQAAIFAMPEDSIARIKKAAIKYRKKLDQGLKDDIERNHLTEQEAALLSRLKNADEKDAQQEVTKEAESAEELKADIPAVQDSIADLPAVKATTDSPIDEHKVDAPVKAHEASNEAIKDAEDDNLEVLALEPMDDMAGLELMDELEFDGMDDGFEQQDIDNEFDPKNNEPNPYAVDEKIEEVKEELMDLSENEYSDPETEIYLGNLMIDTGRKGKQIKLRLPIVKVSHITASQEQYNQLLDDKLSDL